MVVRVGCSGKLAGFHFGHAYEEWVRGSRTSCCELAEGYLRESDFEGAGKHLKPALAANGKRVRSLILLGRVDVYTGDVGRGVPRLQKSG